MDLLSDMRSRVLVASSLAERLFLTRDFVPYALAFFSSRREYDLFFTLGSQIRRLPAYRGLIYQFGKTWCL